MDDSTSDMRSSWFSSDAGDAALSGQAPADDSVELAGSAGLQAIAALSRAARQAGSADELADEDAVVTKIVAALRAPESDGTGQPPRRSTVFRKLALAKVVPIAAGVVIVTSAAAAAATGSLPGWGSGKPAAHDAALGSRLTHPGSLAATSGSGSGTTGNSGSTTTSVSTTTVPPTTTTSASTTTLPPTTTTTVGNTGGGTGATGGTGPTGATGSTGSTGNSGTPPPAVTVSAGGPYRGDEGASIAIAGTAADTNPNAKVTTTWSVAAAAGTSGSCTIGAASMLATTLSCTEEGGYSLTLSGTDGTNNAVPSVTTVTVADAALTATGNSIISMNPVSGVLATFTDADPNGTLTDYSATIDWGDGTASSVGTVGQGATAGTFSVSGSHTYAALGVYVVKVEINDVGGATATATTNVITYALTSGGAFVVGDGSAGGPTPGNAVVFWGAQWAQDNQLSSGSAPPSFKGFESSSATPGCPMSWTTGPGNSASPPAIVPSFTAMVVATTVTKSGKTISGDGVHVVIVHTGAGYGPNPGHTGNGTIVAVLC